MPTLSSLDLLQQHSCWDSILVLFTLVQLITSPTRTTPTSSLLLDHTYTNNPSSAVTTDVSDFSISDHNPISCTRSIKLPKPEPKGHARIVCLFFVFVYLSNILTECIFADLICMSFDNVTSTHGQAPVVWYKLFMDVVNRHAPIRHKRVKHSELPPWLNKIIIQALSDVD